MSSGDSEERVLVLAPWGLPTLWDEVNYVIPRVSESGGKLCVRPINIEWNDVDKVKSYTSLAGVLRYITNAGHKGFIDVIIMGLDTLAFPDTRSQSGNCNVVGILSDFTNTLRNGKVNYRDIENTAYSLLKNCISQYLGGFNSKADKINIEVEILPGTGTYRAGNFNARFMGGINNLNFTMLYKLYNKVRYNKYSAIIIDITHGVNYLPMITYMAAQLIAKYLSARDNKDICLITFNADPISRQKTEATQERRLNIIEMQNISIEPHEFLKELTGRLNKEKIFRIVRTNHDKDKINKLNKLNNNYEDIRRRLNPSRITTSLEYGFALYLVTYLRKNNLTHVKDLEELSRNISNLCDEIYNYMNEAVDISINNNEVLISRIYDFETSPLLLSMAFDVVRNRVINVLNLDQLMDNEGGIDIEYLLKIPVSSVADTILSNEVDSIKRAAELFRDVAVNLLGMNKGILGGYVKYGNIHDFVNKSIIDIGRRSNDIREEIKNYSCDNQDSHDDSECRFNDRNFIAHAGLERNITCIKISGDKVFIKYIDKCFEDIDKHMENISKGNAK
ncbi:CRISPR-associated CARF protein Csx1 [Caldivirga maquilingensis]|uniref:CRISPR-associated protein DxTHG motif n=1 Tax=Caldivirga maquilingensis (strain ATCC 700844 / DSM 13496 / JCM 10307 / IC-167) TaxID=397948 RepID=A8M9B5_CALMQ|nr:CRISPR-associated CARF protein Csx1 [Caldivirga maquilingensis]ABW02334.1 CRISPR-associated protein DxTHG motif [Caldivirga maquilingensis IC-167]